MSNQMMPFPRTMHFTQYNHSAMNQSKKFSTNEPIISCIVRKHYILSALLQEVAIANVSCY